MDIWNPGRRQTDKNQYRYIDDHVVEVKLNKDRVTYMDKEDIPLLDEACWSVSMLDTPYPCIQGGKHTLGDSRLLSRRIMQRVLFEKYGKDRILNTKELVAHLNGDMFDNRRGNLEIRDRSISTLKGRAHKGNTTSTKGVCYVKKSSYYIASIRYKGNIHRKIFSVSKYGYEAALVMAKKWRHEQEAYIFSHT